MSKSETLRFCAPGDEPIPVRTLSGHSVMVSPDGTDVHPRFRAAAVTAGCELVSGGARRSKKTPDAPPTPSKHDLICEAIVKLIEQKGGVDQFGDDGKPDVRELKDVAGFGLSASERDAAWADVKKSLDEA
ncbi:hypothetical protein JN531_003745 [Flagellatimonas centrodinii]|uniref:hypothetical protein n=1 Tax=Flagellatimonas centrodinii TaxID=2806210 RepID=UPI001FEE4FB6|nr:hypothetical protein [Flagellatimonas centrodinii]ULQ47400.1 hypothetical protein JN531_003745 [Flagellatimonas centrodinii]